MYFISSNGIAFSTSNNQYKNVNKIFTFNEGDLIYVEYDPIDWRLRFRKNENDSSRF